MDKKVYIPRGRFTQYMADTFYRNNREAIDQLIQSTAEELGLSDTDYDSADVADKICFAISVDFYSSQLLSNPNTIADLCAKHTKNILEKSPEEPITRAEARQAFYDLKAQASDLPEMSLEEINAEISAARAERKNV